MRKTLLIVGFILGFVLGINLVNSVSADQTAQSSLRKLIDYQKPSETIAYPDLAKFNQPNLLVNLKKHRVYVRDGKQTKYIMYCSGGQANKKTGKSDTPTGKFTIQEERGNSFYNQKLGEGADYWTSFKDHGIYLFHTVPTNESGDYKPAEAKKLGKVNASHGCIRLSVPDAKWINQNVPTGTPVIIK